MLRKVWGLIYCTIVANLWLIGSLAVCFLMLAEVARMNKNAHEQYVLLHTKNVATEMYEIK